MRYLKNVRLGDIRVLSFFLFLWSAQKQLLMLSGQCFFFFEMLTIKYDRMALVNIEKLQTLTMQRWLQLFVCRSCTSTYWPGMPFLRLSYWRSHQIPTTRDLKKVPLCFLFLHVLDFALTISFRKSWVRLFYWKLALHYVKWQLHLSTLHHKTYRESN